MAHEGRETISERLLEGDEGLIITIPTSDASRINAGGSQIRTNRAYFFKVTKEQRLYWEYTQLPSIGAGNNLNFGYLGENGHPDDVNNPGDDIFRLENDDFKVYHFGLGTDQSDLRVYEKVAPSNPNRAFDHSNQDEPNPQEPSTFGFYTGNNITDQYDPENVSERIAFRNAQRGRLLQWGFYAESNLSAADTDLVFTGRTYQLRPVLDPQEQNRMLEENARRRAGAEVDLNVVRVSLAGIFGFDIGASLPDSWANLGPDLYQDVQAGALASGSQQSGGSNGSGTERPSGSNTTQSSPSRF